MICEIILRLTKGAGLRILTETITSPSLAAQIQDAAEGISAGAKWHQWEAVFARSSACTAAQMAIGTYAEPIYRFDKADVILSLDADFLYSRAGRGAICAGFCFAAIERRWRREFRGEDESAVCG